MTFLQNQYQTRYGLLPFFDEITYQEHSIFARKYYKTYYQPTREDFEQELYIILLENAEELEELCTKAIKYVEKEKPHLLPENIKELNTTNPEYAYIAKIYRIMLKTFLRNKTMRWWEKRNIEKWQDLKNKSNAFYPWVVTMLLKQAQQEGFTIPEIIQPLTKLTHIPQAEAIKQIAKEQNINRKKINWTLRLWCINYLTYQENTTYELPIHNPQPEEEH